MAIVRYLVDDVDASLPFYRALGFKLADRWGPPFAIAKGRDLSVWLSGPGTSARKRLKSGPVPNPGGWNRLVISVEDIAATVAKLKALGIAFRSRPVAGPGGSMNRRIFLRSVGGGLLLAPALASAQQPAMPTVGILLVQSFGLEQFRRRFAEAFRRYGYVDGRNIRFEYRSSDGAADRLNGLAAELVAMKVDAIVARLTPAGTAAKGATSVIPIVCGPCGGPVETGLVASLARPGGNVTGVASVGPELARKVAQFVRDTLPAARRVVALANASDPFSKPFVENIRAGGRAAGFGVEVVSLRGPADVDSAFASLARSRPDAVITQPTLGLKQCAQRALEHRLPAASILTEFVEEGGLMSYAASDDAVFESVAGFVDKILKGAKPADLPVVQPTRYELAFNLKTARALGVVIPRPLLERADHVIE